MKLFKENVKIEREETIEHGCNQRHHNILDTNNHNTLTHIIYTRTHIPLATLEIQRQTTTL